METFKQSNSQSEGLVDRVLTDLENRRQRVINGEVNCIPSPFRVFQNDYPGIQQGMYYLISGASKSGKSQLASYLFLYSSIFYAYNNPNKVRLKIFYFPLEETPENIMTRFMCHLLYVNSKFTIRISPTQLKSIKEGVVVDEEILQLLHSEEYQKILKFFESRIEFVTDRNPTGYYKKIKEYAQNNGTSHKKTIIIPDKVTGIETEKEVFDYYKPNDPNEYVIAITDHISLCETERGLTLKQCMDKWSEYGIILRNKYKYIIVNIQQQNQDTINLEAFKENKVRPTLAGLADTKNTGKDCNVFIGITNPYAFELPLYPYPKDANNKANYSIRDLKGYFRFLEIVLNRDGESNGMLPLYFDGAVNYFTPMPASTNMTELTKIYAKVKNYSGIS